ncbi:hypothetical protein D3875_17260 [Deinococcus cavernae]|uniref:Lipoprotein n=1 Tax=Deinococcus cavernae TaxID=2320857 RepID=A0A418VA80_9DEIO|nr:hypothetical protein [Deinococcus cavernae]RJF73031.1 hypothetical protein D3875_17260 [Deinococcus cavernae]
MPRISLSRSVFLAGSLLLAACTPRTTTPPAVYQAPKAEVMQAVTEIASSFAALPTYQSLVLWSKHSSASQLTLTSAVRIRADAQGAGVVDVNDERQITFSFQEKAGWTTVSVSQTGPVAQQVATVFQALDRRFVRVNQP